MSEALLVQGHPTKQDSCAYYTGNFEPGGCQRTHLASCLEEQPYSLTL